jgi:HPt (histidine-containing phosphotransfer) domain-containing protein
VSIEEGKTIEISDPFARKLVGDYLENRRADVAKLTQALLDSDFETIRVTGHNLFGSGAAYGFEAISEMGAGIESAAATRDIPCIERHIADLRNLLGQVKIR